MKLRKILSVMGLVVLAAVYILLLELSKNTLWGWGIGLILILCYACVAARMGKEEKVTA